MAPPSLHDYYRGRIAVSVKTLMLAAFLLALVVHAGPPLFRVLDIPKYFPYIYGVKSRSGHDRSQSFGPISHVSGPKLSF